MAQSALCEQILVNATELMCKLNPDNQHHVSEHRLIVLRYGKGESKGYKAVIIDYAVIRIEGPRADTFDEALEGLLDFTAEQLKPHLDDYENMKFSHIKGEVLEKCNGGRIAVKAPKEETPIATSPTKKVGAATKKLESLTKNELATKRLESPTKKVDIPKTKIEVPKTMIEVPSDVEIGGEPAKKKRKKDKKRKLSSGDGTLA